MVDKRFLIYDKRTAREGEFVIDKDTGEIIGEYDSCQPMFPHEELPRIAPQECNSVDEWNAYLKDHVDLRRFPKPAVVALHNAQDLALGFYFRKDGDYRISAPMMKLLVKLLKLVQYRNIIIDSQTGLAESLGVNKSNLIKTLSILSDKGLLRIYTASNSQMRTGEIKLLIAPDLIFRGHDKQQQSAIGNWYKPDGRAIVEALVQEALYNLEQYQQRQQRLAA